MRPTTQGQHFVNFCMTTPDLAVKKLTRDQQVSRWRGVHQLADQFREMLSRDKALHDQTQVDRQDRPSMGRIELELRGNEAKLAVILRQLKEIADGLGLYIETNIAL